jgi:uncharacterized protein YecE (DUF72 family)
VRVHVGTHGDGPHRDVGLELRPLVRPETGTLYAVSYGDAALSWWADRVRKWAAPGRDVFAYFNNDGHGHAVRNAERLRALVGA